MRYAVACLLFAACARSPAREPQPPPDAAPVDTVTVRGSQRDVLFRVSTLYSIEGTAIAASDDSTVTTWPMITVATDVLDPDSATPPASGQHHSEVAYFYRVTVTGRTERGDSVSLVRFAIWERGTGREGASPVTAQCAQTPTCASLIPRMHGYAAKLRRDPRR